VRYAVSRESARSVCRESARACRESARACRESASQHVM